MLFPVLAWEGRGQEEQAVRTVCLPPLSHSRGVGACHRGKLGSLSVALRLPWSKVIACCGSLPWPRELLQALFLTLICPLVFPFLHVSFNKWGLWSTHLAFGFSSFSRTLPTHTASSASSHIQPSLRLAPSPSPSPHTKECNVLVEETDDTQ